MFDLTVLHAFGPYAKGDTIHDADEVRDVLASENAMRVIKVAAGVHKAFAAAAVEAEADAAHEG